MAVTKENVHNSTTEHGASRPNSEKPKEDEVAVYIFCKESLTSTASGER
jgi:hypothetical protein